MRFLFRRPSAATSTAALPQVIEHRDLSEAGAERLVAEIGREEIAHEEARTSMSFAPGRELVAASQLPSASAALADLFPEDEGNVAGVGLDIETAFAPEDRPEPSEHRLLESREASVGIKIGASDSDKTTDTSFSAELNLAPSTSLAATEPVDQEQQAVAQKQTMMGIAPATNEDSLGRIEPEPPRWAEAANEREVTARTSHAAISEEMDISPEDAATVMAAASEEIAAEEAAAQGQQNSAKEEANGKAAAPRPPLPVSTSNWAFEETLASHREWVESKGAAGKKADLASAQLDGVELIGVNLRLADLHYANLRGTDLLLTDLRDACLVRADLEESCLVGANLEGANLEGASMETALGLVPRQLAGSNLREAMLPAQIAQFPAEESFRVAAQSALHFFTSIMVLSAASCLAIWKTKDIQLVTDSAILPFLHSRTAAAAMPAAEIFLIAPVALFLLYVAFIAKIQRLWTAVLELPAVFPDGRSLGEKESSIVLGLLRAHFRWMNQDAPSARPLETALCQLLAYWVVPATLVLYWARYLTLQEIHGTILQELLAAIAIGVGLYATFKVGRPQERWGMQRNLAHAVEEKLRGIRPPAFAMAVLMITTFLSFGTIAGIPYDVSRAPQFGEANVRRWAPSVLWALGYDPYANLTEASFSRAPANWSGATDQVAQVRGIHLDNPRFRYAQAYGAFLANSKLLHADFRGAYLSNADFRGADLTQSNLQFAIMDSVHMNHANLDRAILDGAHLARADFRDANLSYAYLANSFLMDARFDGASLYNAVLSHSTMVRTNMEKADLRNSRIEESNLEHADLQQAYLWSASLQNSDLKEAQLGSAILIGASLRGANLGGTHFAGTVLNETDLSGAALDGADLRGAFGLTAHQVCSARSHTGAMFDDELQSQVQAECGR